MFPKGQTNLSAYTVIISSGTHATEEMPDY
jgi:hypothetical protein